MSSTTGNKIDKDNYPTPIKTVEALLNKLNLRPGDKFLEPCRGSRNIYDRINLPEYQKSWAELAEGVDYLTTPFEKQDVIITNPPFSLTVEFIRKSMSELADGGTMVYLQRVNFLGSKCRLNFWAEIGFPDKTPVIVPRPRFVKGGSDSCEYMWMIWDNGDRFNMPQGISHIVSEK